MNSTVTMVIWSDLSNNICSAEFVDVLSIIVFLISPNIDSFRALAPETSMTESMKVLIPNAFSADWRRFRDGFRSLNTTGKICGNLRTASLLFSHLWLGFRSKPARYLTTDIR